MTVSIVAQLGADATAGNWKVDLYEFVGKDNWTNIGDLTGGGLLCPPPVHMPIILAQHTRGAATSSLVCHAY